MMRFTAPVLGIPVTVVSPSADVLAVAESSFGPWRGIAAWPELVAARGVTVEITVDEALGVPPPGAEPVTYRRAGASRVELAGHSCEGWADAAAGAARLRVAPSLVAATEQFRYLALEAAVLFLVTGRNRLPVHAAAVMRAGTALLLHGRSGVGKSTLAWLAGESGWQLLSDDIIYLQSEPRWRVWGGGSARAWFAAGAERFIAGLAGREPELRAGDTRKFSLLRTMPMPPVAERAILCVLERGAAPLFEPLAEATAMARLLHAPDPGFDTFVREAAGALRPLAARAVRLVVGPAPQAMVGLLEKVESSFLP